MSLNRAEPDETHQNQFSHGFTESRQFSIPTNSSDNYIYINNQRSSSTSKNGQKFLYTEEKSANVSSSNEDDVLKALDAAFPKDDKQGFLKRARGYFKTRNQVGYDENQQVKDDFSFDDIWKRPQKESKK